MQNTIAAGSHASAASNFIIPSIFQQTMNSNFLICLFLIVIFVNLNAGVLDRKDYQKVKRGGGESVTGK